MLRRYWNSSKIFLRYQLGFSQAEFRGGMLLVMLVFCLSLYRMYTRGLPMESPVPILPQPNLPVIEPLKLFDPDTVSSVQLASWGMPEDIAVRWVKYRQTIGGYKNKLQISRIYGLPDSLFRAWEDSIYFAPGIQKKRQRGCPAEMDLNFADSTMLMRLHGIGKILSGRIIKYRSRLGGFTHVAQLREVYGLRDSTFTHIRKRVYVDQSFAPKKLLLDSVNYQQLYDHPYIHSKEATAILRYRKQHPGKVCLKNILAIDSAARLKMLPYVTESCDVMENERSD